MTRTITVEMTKDEAVAIVGAINFAAQAERSFERHGATMSAYQRVQAGLRDYYGIGGQPRPKRDSA